MYTNELRAIFLESGSYMKAILSTLSLWTRILKMLQGAFLLLAHVVNEGRPRALYVDARGTPDGSSVTFLKLCFCSLEMYGVSGINHCLPRRTGHCPNYFIC